MTRRALLFASLPLLAAAKARKAVDAVDHLIVGARDLEAAMEWLAQMTGVKPVKGGVHPGRGTWNALLSLGGRQYLELIAPDPKQTTGGEDVVAQLKTLATPELIGWAASGTNLDAWVKRILEAVGPIAGSRRRGDGKLLEWRSVQFSKKRFSEVPFFIEWGPGSAHPSSDSPQGCKLRALTFQHQTPGAFRDALAELEIDAVVEKGPKLRLQAKLDTPNGPVTL